jgi:DNA-binding NarL/FixJ family response regulator
METLSPQSSWPGPIQIVIVDDHLVLVEALRMYIQSQPDLAVVDTAGDCAGCLSLIQRLADSGSAPQVLLLDVSLPDGDGIELAPSLKKISPQTNILILTSLSEETTLLRAMQAGVSGFVSKSRNLAEVIQSIRKAAAGEIAVPTGLLLGLLNRAAQSAAAAPPRSKGLLTQREREILALLAQGKSVEDIAAHLTIAAMTVNTHIRNLMHKLNVHSRLQAVSYAISHGMIDPPL